MDSLQIIESLRQKKFKITKVRSGIVVLFTSAKAPLSANELIKHFHQNNNKVNKTTIYRELFFLLNENIIKEIEFGDGQKRYELEDHEHHHHLVCLKCRKVEDVELITDLALEENRILKQTGFKVVNHSLEFFGYCKNCR